MNTLFAAGLYSSKNLIDWVNPQTLSKKYKDEGLARLSAFSMNSNPDLLLSFYNTRTDVINPIFPTLLVDIRTRVKLYHVLIPSTLHVTERLLWVLCYVCVRALLYYLSSISLLGCLPTAKVGRREVLAISHCKRRSCCVRCHCLCG